MKRFLLASMPFHPHSYMLSRMQMKENTPLNCVRVRNPHFPRRFC